MTDAAHGIPETDPGSVLDRGGRPVAGADVILLPCGRTLEALGLRALIAPGVGAAPAAHAQP